MTDREIARFLEEGGYPEHLRRGGKQGLIDRWAAFVAEVEEGYACGLEDYRNDLDIRGIIAQAGLDEEVWHLDARLREMLTGRDRRVWKSAGQEDAAPFWDYGYPKNASGDLLDDLRAEGLAG